MLGPNGEATGQEERDVISFNFRPPAATFTFGDVSENQRKLAEIMEAIANRFNDFNYRGSGWQLADCLYFELDIGQCLSMQGSCSLHPINSDSKGGIQVLQEQGGSHFGHRCFYHAIASVLMSYNQKGKAKAETELALERFIRENVNEVAASPVAMNKVKIVMLVLWTLYAVFAHIFF